MSGPIYLLQRFYDHDTSPKTLNRANSVNKTIDADELKAAWTNNFGIIIFGKKLNEFSQIFMGKILGYEQCRTLVKNWIRSTCPQNNTVRTKYSKWTVTGHEDPKKWLCKMVFIELFKETCTRLYLYCIN